jgi:carotenoid cleavage dioxygenase-like enzyme
LPSARARGREGIEFPRCDERRVGLAPRYGWVVDRRIATVRLPRRVPHGFHGSWIADPA